MRYVSASGTSPVPPYITWATAATNINDAVNLSVSGDQILVTNGVYKTGGVFFFGQTNRVFVGKPVTVQSVNGPAVTIIEGYQTNDTNAVRCAWLADGARLSGFTLTDGAASPGGGGGVWCNSSNCVISDCVITGNTAYTSSGGGVFNGILINCKVIGNTASTGPGGGAGDSTLIGCVLANNFTQTSFGSAAFSSTLINCTVVGNTSAVSAPSIAGGSVVNSIVYYNFRQYTNADIYYGYALSNCCVSFSTNGVLGANNFTNPPLFADLAAGDFHLSAVSPCINAGSNAFGTGGADLDGDPRIADGTVDMGAYEFQSPRHFVSLSSVNPVSPYASWDTAATNIQDAVDAAIAGDFVIVSNGIYQTGGRTVNGYALANRVVVDKAVTVQSVNGAKFTAIAGVGKGNLAVRGVYLAGGASLTGFTLMNGQTMTSGDVTNQQSGAGVWCEDNSAVISDCIFTNNYAEEYGGAAYQGTLNNCLIVSNSAFIDGGGTFRSDLNNCSLIENKTIQGFGGGGACYGILNRCLVSSNFAFYGGGVCSNLLNNCLLKNNSASTGGGAYNSVLVNCTVVSNTASSTGGGMYGGSATNSIIYYNSAPVDINVGNGQSLIALAYCCTTPFPKPAGIGNITNEPAFANLSAGDFHLQSGSPCVNSGDNSAAASSTDLDGNPRIVGGVVDMGAYEDQSPFSLHFYAHLFPPTNGSPGLIISWQSVNGLNYFIQRSTNLAAQPAFFTIHSGILGLPGMTTYTDRPAISQGPYFYRVGWQ
jgi:hypothetical protein